MNPSNKITQLAKVEWVRTYAEFLNEELVPIGGHSHMGIYLGRDGVFYGGFDAQFGPLGRSVRVMIDRVLNNVPPTQLPTIVV
jgi:hypothetical protein